MKEEIKIFLTAVMFYTRIPCPSWVDHSADYVNKSIRYFPLIGWMVGTVTSLGFIGGSLLVSPLFGAIVYVIFSVWMTGAFHEDGFADVCDGFGGGWTKEQILNIMKDSRVGTYAVVGLLLLILIKVSLLSELAAFFTHSPLTLLLIGVSGHSLSRLMAASVIFSHPYVREDELSKVKPVAKSYTTTNVILSVVFGLLPVVALGFIDDQWYGLLVPFPVYLVKIYLARFFKKWIGGYTGDCLGATQQVTEVFYYLVVFIVWKYI